MLKKVLMLATAAGLIVASSLPASAQFADFFCDTIRVGCSEPPPPPPPPVEAAPAPVVKKVVKKKPKPKVEKAAPAAPAAPPSSTAK